MALFRPEQGNDWPFSERYWAWRVVAVLGLGRRALTTLVAIAGVALGAIAAGVSGFWGGATKAEAAARYAASMDLRDAPDIGFALVGGNWVGDRQGVFSELRDADNAMGLAAPRRLGVVTGAREPIADRFNSGDGDGERRPRIIIIVDDLGLDRRATLAALDLPGPLTLSFLPYANGVQPLADEARAQGHAVMLHLPMEPSGVADAGPNALTKNMSSAERAAALDWHLSQFDGYAAVNNHMGSRLTADPAAMRQVLAELNARDLYFVDSVTTGESVVHTAGEAVGAEVYARDLFLDAEPGAETVARQLRRLESIARKTGLAVAICHPRSDTLKVLGPWLTTAEARGFDLETVGALRETPPGKNAPVQLRASLQ